mgnify:CR=1 FL=1|jgi:hypothetical protein
MSKRACPSTETSDAKRHATYVQLVREHAVKPPTCTHAEYIKLIKALTAHVPTTSNFKTLSSYVTTFQQLNTQNKSIAALETEFPQKSGEAARSVIVAWVTSLNKQSGISREIAIPTSSYEHDERNLYLTRTHMGKSLPRCIMGRPNEQNGNGCAIFRISHARRTSMAMVDEPLCMYLSRDQQSRWESTGEIPDSTPMCILCIRFLTHRMALYIKQSGSTPACHYQEYQVNVDVPGGYRRDACIMPDASNHLVGPIVAFDEDKLQIVEYIDPANPQEPQYVVNQQALCSVF